jgi:restriction system protein
MSEFRSRLAVDMAVSEEDRNEKLPSGTQTKYENRIAWAAVYLNRAGFLERVHRGVFRITPRGREVLATNPEKITVKLLSQFPEFRQFHQGKPVPVPAEGAILVQQTEAEDTETPEETLEASFQDLQNSTH